MKGYKGFNKGLVCRDKQYAENAIFEEDRAEICKSGMHFCLNPLDVLKYYPLIDNNGELNEFAEVEALDECLTDDDKKYTTKKLKIGCKLSLGEFVNASVEFLKENTSEKYSKVATSGYDSKVATSGDDSQVATSGYDSKVATSGDGSKVANSGDYSKVANSGYGSQVATSGDDSQVATSGYGSKVATSGYDSKVATSGDGSQVATSGYGSKVATSGNYSKVANSGENSVIANIGNNGKAKAVKGCWITLAEYNGDKPVCVKTEYVDDERIKENTWYKLENGEFKEVE